MKILLLSDVESRALWDCYRPGRLDGIDLILSCGDLKADYLSFLVTMANVPLLYVHGNHDASYAKFPPEGCECVDGKLVTVNGLRILGLGGSMRYNGGAHQYTERQMAWRLMGLWPKLLLAGGADIVLTHAPARGVGDADDPAHRGFACFRRLLDTFRPGYLVHGHVHMNYGANVPRVLTYGETTVINAFERYILEI
ncbi:MAG: metallophosphoesterase family protein [Oscillospiraceae bacterium]|nr:metallophosphoesterase family protein [Oscillospiraceae bacterium]